MSYVSEPHISDTELLAMPAVGRVPRRQRGREHPRIDGLMNTGLLDWGAAHPLEPGEYDELAELFDRSVETVRRWFGQTETPANCVPLEVMGVPSRFGRPARPRQRVCTCTREERRRIFLAACLAVPGGLCRTDDEGWFTPIFTYKDRTGQLLVEYETRECGSLAEAVEYVELCYDGVELDDNNLYYAQSWVQMKIYQRPEGWDVVIARTYPAPGDDSGVSLCDLAVETGGFRGTDYKEWR